MASRGNPYSLMHRLWHAVANCVSCTLGHFSSNGLIQPSVCIRLLSNTVNTWQIFFLIGTEWPYQKNNWQWHPVPGARNWRDKCQVGHQLCSVDCCIRRAVCSSVSGIRLSVDPSPPTAYLRQLTWSPPLVSSSWKMRLFSCRLVWRLNMALRPISSMESS